MGAVSLRLPFRGGNWNNTSNAGVFALNLNNPRSNVNTNIGFRAALAPHVRSRALTGDGQHMGQKGHISPPPQTTGGEKVNCRESSQ
jgi:hypothetical protein